MQSIQRRMRFGGIELRQDGDEAPTVSGYAAVFYRDSDPGTQYQLWPGAVERIHRGAFDEVISRNEDVYGLFNHNPDNVLGRTKSGTLRLSVDDVGLRYEITPSESRAYQDVVSYLERGDVDGSSFSFMLTGETDSRWDTDDGVDVRNIENISQLLDVGPVVMPAYDATSAQARAIGDISTERDEYRRLVERDKIKREAELREMVLREMFIELTYSRSQVH